MALSADQLVFLAEATREAYATVETRAATLNAAQESRVSDILDLWEDVADSFILYKDKVDFDEGRDRQEIFYRLRQILGLPLISFELELAMSGTLAVGHTAVW